MALLEAMAVKVPVICSDIRGNLELIEEKELLFDPRNDSSIANCIRGALTLDLSKTVENHYKRVFKYRTEEADCRMRLEYLKADKRMVRHRDRQMGQKTDMRLLMDKKRDMHRREKSGH